MSNNSAVAARSPLALWAIALGGTVVLVAVSYVWLDRPIAYFSYNELHRPRVCVWMTLIPEWFTVAAVVALIGLGLYSLTGRTMAKPLAVIFLASLSLVASKVIKDQLKIVFGRTWPETWTNNNPSLIRDGVSSFHPFSAGSWYESFPSGHTTATCAVIGVLWFCWPKFRPLYVLIVAAVVIGLLGADYHFLGDIIAGAFVGLSAGWIAVRLWEAGGAPSVLPMIPARSEVTAPSPRVSARSGIQK